MFFVDSTVYFDADLELLKVFFFPSRHSFVFFFFSFSFFFSFFFVFSTLFFCFFLPIVYSSPGMTDWGERGGVGGGESHYDSDQGIAKTVLSE